LRVCHVAYTYYPFDVRVHKEVTAIRAAGHEVDVIVMQDFGEPREELIDGTIVHRIPIEIVRGGVARYIFQYALFLLLVSVLLLRLQFRRRFAIVHVHSLPDFQVFCAIPEKAFGARVVLDLHEAMPEILAARLNLAPEHYLVRAAKALEWVSCAIADGVLVVNESIRDLLQERGVETSKMSVVMNSPDLSSLTAATENPRAPTEKIVYAGGINSERDLHSLVRASAKLQATHPHELVFYGSGLGTYQGFLSQIAASLGLTGRFRLAGRIPTDQVHSLILQSAVGPVTYERNSLTLLAVPNKIFEYAAARVPIVAADLPAIRRVFGDAALYYNPGNPEDLASKIARVFEDTHTAAALVQRASKVLDACSWAIMQRRLLALYAQLFPAGEQ